MKNVSKETLTRTVVLAVALINQILTVLEINPLPFAEEEIYNTVSTAATAVAALWAWWKNNSFTSEAIQADKYLEDLKEGEKKGKEE
jgi:SPP1 family holin